MMKTSGAILLLAALLGLREALPVEGEGISTSLLRGCIPPTFAGRMGCIEAETACHNASECLTDQMCCISKCKIKCVPIHAGGCPLPRIDSLLVCLPGREFGCDDDSSCAADEKCCFTFCGRSCL
ncbi:hypothetical protein NDU88_011487 [Pleurodeles waltl]|uniref:WAP domain-containing protein n=1 Tax=Pleurodeles waltl TaxID=8319 RepID=A0AAV7S2R8_PLEWA|nr:hypothetical protein NDU88_011487 [Pleurodeles waltl]